MPLVGILAQAIVALHIQCDITNTKLEWKVWGFPYYYNYDTGTGTYLQLVGPDGYEAS